MLGAGDAFERGAKRQQARRPYPGVAHEIHEGGVHFYLEEMMFGSFDNNVRCSRARIHAAPSASPP